MSRAELGTEICHCQASPATTTRATSPRMKIRLFLPTYPLGLKKAPRTGRACALFGDRFISCSFFNNTLWDFNRDARAFPARSAPIFHALFIPGRTHRSAIDPNSQIDLIDLQKHKGQALCRGLGDGFRWGLNCF